MEPVLKMRNIDKRFGNFYALQDVSFDVYPGQVNVLIGENGAGKSTLMKILSGAHQKMEEPFPSTGRKSKSRVRSTPNSLELAPYTRNLCLCRSSALRKICFWAQT